MCHGIHSNPVCILIRRGLFEAVTLNFLTVGHTHEDVDALFAMLLSRVVKRVRFQTPEELLGYIEAGWQGHFEQKSEMLWVNFLDHVFDYGQLM